MKKFEELGLSQGLLTIIREAGFETPSEIQEKTIPLALAGNDIIGGAVTGSGKTLVFASPIIENLKPNKTVQALVLTPTRELAEQVANSISFFSRNKKLRILSVYGGVNIENQIRKIQGTDIIVGTPGRILDHLQRRTLELNKIKFLVLDEVDRMFDMGFLRDVEKILSQCSKQRQTMLFSATISADVSHLAKHHTKNPTEISVTSYIDHSKLTQCYYDLDNDEKFSLLVHLLEQEKGNLVMIFCGMRHKADFVAKNLARQGINAQAIHGGLTQSRRTNILEDFHRKKINVLVCTDVAARGLDIKGISHIYNYDLPATSVDYIHRIGRTARAGKDGKVINLLSNKDYENFNNILKDRNLKIIQEQKPEFKKIFIELHRSFGNRNSNQQRFGNRQRSFGRPRQDKHDHGEKSGPRRERTNRAGGGGSSGNYFGRRPDGRKRSFSSGGSSSHSQSNSNRPRSNFHSRGRRGNY